MVISALSAIIVIVYVLRKVFNAVLREGGIGLEADPISSLYTALQLDACTIGIRNIRTRVSAYIIHLSSQYQLVLVVHVIKISTGAPDVRNPFISCLHIYHTLRFRKRCWRGFKIIPVRLVAGC